MTGTQDITICPHCLFPNEGEAIVCARCGKEIVQTINVADVQLPSTAQIITSPPGEVAPDSLTLMVSGFKAPLIVHRQQEILIGRRVPEQDAPDVDLAPYNGYKLGVSRRHAILRCQADNCAIEDQGSSNLTWVNESQLKAFRPYTLHSGDSLRLGRLMMTIYFTSVEIVYLYELTPPATHHMTPAYMVRTLSPYLQALSGLQNVIDLARGREPAEVVVSDIRHDDVSGVTQVTLRRAGEAVQVFHKHVEPWIKAHSIPTVEGEKAAYEEGLKKLAETVLDGVVSYTEAQDRAVYSQKLFIVLRSLAQSPLVLTDTPPARKTTAT